MIRINHISLGGRVAGKVTTRIATVQGSKIQLAEFIVRQEDDPTGSKFSQFACEAWRDLADAAAALTDGQAVVLEGRLRARDGADGRCVVVASKIHVAEPAQEAVSDALFSRPNTRIPLGSP